MHGAKRGAPAASPSKQGDRGRGNGERRWESVQISKTEAVRRQPEQLVQSLMFEFANHCTDGKQLGEVREGRESGGVVQN
eukprot:931202-Pyramimonas_sp.AAC.1